MTASREESPRGVQPVVRCDVRNCVYHDGDETCSANRINVGPAYAVSSADTVCATFKQKNL